MRLRDAGLSLLGGAVVYVAMAACSAGGATSSSHGSGAGGRGGAGGTSHGGSSPSSSGGPGGDSGLLDAIADALTDPVPDAKADPMDGSRLKAYYRSGSDGSKEAVPNLWFDSQRNEDCSFSTAADGAVRCLPTGTRAYGTYFSDATCSTLVAYYPTGCPAPLYVNYSPPGSTSSCPSGLTGLYPVGAALATPAKIYNKVSAVSCLLVGTAPAYAYYSVGAEIPPATFVGSTLAHD